MSTEKEALPEEVRHLVARGRKVEAVRRLRELTGAGLKEAKALVEDNISVSSGLSGRAGEMPSAAIAALHQGDKIEAVRHVRQVLLPGMKDAKEFVEAFLEDNESVRRRFERQYAERFRANMKNFLMFCVMAAVVCYFFMNPRVGL